MRVFGLLFLLWSIHVQPVFESKKRNVALLDQMDSSVCFSTEQCIKYDSKYCCCIVVGVVSHFAATPSKKTSNATGIFTRKVVSRELCMCWWSSHSNASSSTKRDTAGWLSRERAERFSLTHNRTRAGVSSTILALKHPRTMSSVNFLVGAKRQLD